MRKIAVGIAVLVVTICGIAVAPAALASTVDVTVDCHQSVNVQARVGDTVVFHLTSDCSLLGVITDGGEIYLQNTNPAFRDFSGPSAQSTRATTAPIGCSPECGTPIRTDLERPRSPRR